MEFLNFLKDNGKIGMVKECIWALKMLNHLILKRMEKSMTSLKEIGIDHGSENVNKIKFLQFGKVNEDHDNNNNNSHPEITNQSKTNNISMTPDLLPTDEFQSLNYPSDSSQLSTDDLISNLKWFDQWVSEFNQ
ncbi:hypothetical protein BN7_6721 [Wickerhamomyces ciferrii]|uniref:Uncharacterized protein n=1 Tax=Wickerhamomyces ciferrii (strain ATCC 14091 / BCRC 22168 / CBS 111 / JCM 3599 / NBRC 0793 / NRRL Y-1031 F-60-10) TaxID=1206466 RepID=K0KPA5_WICCF|nr:uncharacterized protein BN7_6721 [Wickerhamomyces ciferrii]CCH47110.1 hypothetical protein BN7_6721 [Wickerhamomyces ciferrii]